MEGGKAKGGNKEKERSCGLIIRSGSPVCEETIDVGGS